MLPDRSGCLQIVRMWIWDMRYEIWDMNWFYSWKQSQSLKYCPDQPRKQDYFLVFWSFDHITLQNQNHLLVFWNADPTAPKTTSILQIVFPETHFKHCNNAFWNPTFQTFRIIIVHDYRSVHTSNFPTFNLGKANFQQFTFYFCMPTRSVHHVKMI